MKKLFFIFIIALIIRFVHFSLDTVFSYEPARDAYNSLEILKGHLKLIGPPSSVNSSIFHGPLIYYLWAPVLYLTSHNIEALSAWMRILNVLGIIPVFLIGKNMFNKKVGIVAATLYAISFEQSQYSLFLGHPAMTVLTVLLFYLGLSAAIFKEKKWGIVLVFLGLGLSLQFHYVQIFLLPVLILMFLIYRENIHLDLKTIILSAIVFLLSVSSFIIAEIKFHFRSFQHLSTGFFSSLGGGKEAKIDPTQVWVILQRFIQDNLFFFPFATFLVAILLFSSCIFMYRKGEGKKLIFILLWLAGGFIVYVLTSNESYYYSGGASVSLLVMVAYLICSVWAYRRVLGVAIFTVVLISNIYKVTTTYGPIQSIFNQPGMFLSDEEKAVDYMYWASNHKPFSINALSVPLYVDTTWSYLFETYGTKYGYLPVWGGTLAAGYPGNLKSENKRSSLPTNQFLIIEPRRGLTTQQQKDFITQEDYFSKVVEQKNFGQIVIEEREKI